MATDGIRMFTSKYRRIKKDFDLAREPLAIVFRLSSFLGEKSEEDFRLSVYEKTKNDLSKKYKKDNETSYTTIMTHDTDGAISDSAVNIESSGAALPKDYKEISFQINSTGAIVTGFSFKEKITSKKPY